MMVDIEREVFWNVGQGARWITYILMLMTFFFLIYGLRKRYAMCRIGKDSPFNFSKRLWERIGCFISNGIFHKSILRESYPGLMHLFIFWGFLILVIGTAIVALQDDIIRPLFKENILQGNFYLIFSFLLDLAGIIAVIGIFMALWRRYVTRPERLDNKPDDFITLIWILVVLTTGFFVEGTRIAFSRPSFEVWSFVGWFTSSFFVHLSKDTIAVTHAIFWYGHMLLSFGLIVYIAYSKLLHIITSPLNMMFRGVEDSPTGAIPSVDFDKVERFGASRVEDFTWKQLLEGFACTHCGRCQDSCPAYLTEKPLSPKMVILDINKHLLSTGSQKPGPVLPEEITKGILSCITCGACVEACPVFNRPLDIIIELRRNRVYEGKYDPGHRVALQRTFDSGNPYALTGADRDTVLRVLGIEKASNGETYDVLYWLGCSAYFDERSQDIARAVYKILERAGLKVAALGAKENCCGDFVRRLGDEGLFQKLALNNIEAINGVRFDTLLTHCPHGYNTMKNEYPAFGADFKVIHHTEFISSLLGKGNIQVYKTIGEIVYHDPCYLGRYNNVYDPPREVLNSLAEKIVEFPLSRNRSFCCGAGGGHMWKHEESGTRINDKRIEQSMETGVKTVVTSCPFCLAMLEDALLVKGLGAEMRIKDIAELAEESLHQI